MLNQQQIEQIRSFNRQYTEVLGVFDSKIFGTDLSWTEARIIIEMGVNHRQTPMILAKQLHIDKSYVSRILNKLVKNDLLVKRRSAHDSRSVEVSFTDKGQRTFDQINQQSNVQITDLLADLSDEEQTQFFQSIRTLKQLIFERE